MADMEWVDEMEKAFLNLENCDCPTCLAFRKLIAAVRLAYKRASHARANAGNASTVAREMDDLRDRLRFGDVEEKT